MSCQSNVNTDTYTKTAIILHWLIALMIIGLLGLGLVMGEEGLFPDQTKFMLYGIHKATGLMVIVLTVIRIMWRLMNPPPSYPSTMKPYETTILKLAHFGFYALMLAIPLSGWALTTAAGYAPISIYGIFNWPALPGITAATPMDKEFVHSIGEIHETLAWGMIGLLGLHIAAALKHQFIDKDNILKRMSLCTHCCGACKTETDVSPQPEAPKEPKEHSCGCGHGGCGNKPE